MMPWPHGALERRQELLLFGGARRVFVDAAIREGLAGDYVICWVSDDNLSDGGGGREDYGIVVFVV
jgi:hypothetical protein